MALRLVREASDTPNISNRDDACMVRYAYGGYDGIVENFGQQLSASIGSGKVTVNSGRIVLQGWEVDVETENISVPASTTGSVYEHLYLELNLLLEEARLLTVRSNAQSFPMGLGDDLTQNTSGTARLPLYRWSVSGSSISGLTQISEVIRTSKVIESNLKNQLTALDTKTTQNFTDVNQRLEELGFKEGLFQNALGGTILTNNVNREGNRILGQVEWDSGYSFTRQFSASGQRIDMRLGVITSVDPSLNSKFVPKSGIIKGGCDLDIQEEGTMVTHPKFRTWVEVRSDRSVHLVLQGLNTPNPIPGRVQFSLRGIYFGYEGY